MQCPCNNNNNNNSASSGTNQSGTIAAVGTYTNPIPLPGGATLLTDPCTGYKLKALPYVAPAPLQQEAEAVATSGGGTGAGGSSGTGTTYVQVRYGGGATSATGTTPEGCKLARQPCQRKMCCPPERQSVCVEYPPRRKNCYKNDMRPWQQLYTDAFETDFNIGPHEDNIWNFFSNEDGFTADDGKVRVARDGLTISAREFSKTYRRTHKGKPQLVEDGFLDHFKSYVILNSEFPVPDCGQLYAEARIAGRTFGTEKHRFDGYVVDHTADLRLAACAFTMIDFETGVHIWWAVTNDSYYAVYEVLPIDYEDSQEGESGVKASFAGAFWIDRRNAVNPLTDFATLGLALDKRKGASWYINGNLVHNVRTIGALPRHSNVLYQIAGESKPLDVRCVQIGMGLFTMLDAFPPEVFPVTEANRVGLARLTNFRYCAPFRKDDDATFAVDCPKARDLLFGQGAMMKVKHVKVEFRC
jgi:hypothetical protein